MSALDHIASRIRDLRRDYNHGEGISQEALAKQLGVAGNTVSRWETGTYQPSLPDLEKVARFFGVSIISFFIAVDSEIQDPVIHTLLRTAKSLHPDDLEELVKYAEFRRARRIYKGRTRPKPGRTPGKHK